MTPSTRLEQDLADWLLETAMPNTPSHVLVWRCTRFTLRTARPTSRRACGSASTTMNNRIGAMAWSASGQSALNRRNCWV